ncbi:MAG TPA: LytTR family DNA-binding domain-containing protein [Steroidobacteraceae bacterium]|nr:LytTR family DNA-binding domain-containing protein [Steroidobacteraceae bacterium]
MNAARLKVLIVDDELPARERLRSLLGEIPEVVAVGEAVSGAEALALTHDLAPDIVLLDVRMPGMDGLEAARHLNVLEEPPAVIFTTAYDQYAVEAFEAHAVGYLLKPVRKEQLAAALTRAGRLTRAQLQKLAAAGAEARRTHIAARSREGLKLIPIEQVQYFLADRKYTTVAHVNGEELIEDSLRLLESEFGAAFVRIHRNALVAVKYLEGIERGADGQYFVRLRGCAAPLAVSRRMAGELKERFRI